MAPGNFICVQVVSVRAVFRIVIPVDLQPNQSNVCGFVVR